MAHLIILKKDNSSYTPYDHARNVASICQRGDIVDVLRDGISPANAGARQNLNCCYIEVTDATETQLRNYINPWKTELDFSVVQFNQGQDGYRVDVYATNTSTTDLGIDYGRLTYSDVAVYLADWTATNISNQGNGVIRCDYGVYNVATCAKFWDIGSVDNVVFSELDYNSTTGIHQIEADYSATSYNADRVADRVILRGGSVISNTSGVCVYELGRNNVNTELKQRCRDKFHNTVYYRQYYITNSVVDYIISQGNVISITMAELVPDIHNRLDD